MAALPLDPTSPTVGALLPDFTVRTRDGRTIHRRDFKGRQHLVLCFAAAGEADNAGALSGALAALAPAWRAERAALLIVAETMAVGDAVAESLAIVGEDAGELRARFGVGADAALVVADRYGEIALYARGEALGGDHGLSLGQVLPTLELLEMRCSL